MTRHRVLLANEAGGGRGHVTTLRNAALALGRDVELVAALARAVYAHELSDLGATLVQAPLLARPPREHSPVPGYRGSATWADGIAAIGLGDAEKVGRGLDFWRQTIVRQDISLLIADFAPLALWAARGLRDEGWAVRIVNLGVGYTVPPAGLTRFAPVLPDVTRLIHDEAATLATLNRAGAARGLVPLPRLAALCDVDLSLATSFAFLDPFRAERSPAGRCPPLVAKSAVPANQGDEVFAYFSTAELRDPALVQALVTLPMPRRGYLPSAPDEVQARLRTSGMVVLDAPASADEIAARSRLILHAAPHGTVCLGALAGLPQFAVPQHLEQLFNARQAAGIGILHHCPPGSADMADQIAAAYADRAIATRARDAAQELRRDHPDDPVAALADRLAPLLGPGG